MKSIISGLLPRPLFFGISTLLGEDFAFASDTQVVPVGLLIDLYWHSCVIGLGRVWNVDFSGVRSGTCWPCEPDVTNAALALVS